MNCRSQQQQQPNNKSHKKRCAKNGRMCDDSNKAQFLAMDCEMVGVGEHGRRSALARVTIVNWDHEIVYDKFIRPDEVVTDYRTFVSGITASDLDANEHGSISLDQCRIEVMSLLHNRILVGHALKNDLHALQIRHPWHSTRDTAKYEPFMKVRFSSDGILWPRKLRDLLQERLHKTIQRPGEPHSAYEDAVAAMLLYKSVRVKWEKLMSYKIAKTEEIIHSGLNHPHSEQHLAFATWPSLSSTTATTAVVASC
jgi:RNA exonuclease 4